MIFRCPYIKHFRRAVALVFLLLAADCRGQVIILHLRNGDRIAGTILSENTNQIILSTVWARELIVPSSQIERREIPPSVVVGTNIMTESGIKTVVIAKAGTLPPNTNSFWRRWSGNGATGMDYERGATDHALYYAKASLSYAQPYEKDPKQFFRNILTYDFAYGKTDGTTSDDRMGGTSKSDFDLSRKYYFYNLGEAGYDLVRLVDLHYEEGPGLGYHWITASNFLVNLELGANYQVEDRTDGTRTGDFYFRSGQDLAWKVSKDMNLTEKAEYFLRVGYAQQYRIRFESNLSYALLLHFSFNFTLIDLYDTQPTASIPNNDFQFRTSLGAKF